MVREVHYFNQFCCNFRGMFYFVSTTKDIVGNYE